MDLIPAINVTSHALDAERLRLEITAQNISNAFTTRGPDGKPYQRKEVAFEAFMPKALKGQAQDPLMRAVRVSGIVGDAEPGEKVYKPHHPHADENGMVSMPNVKMAEEMVNLINASNATSAILTSIDTSHQLVRKAMSIGKS